MARIDDFLDARLVDPATLADQPLVALDHVEAEIRSLVARLAEPERAARIGAEIPRSILLHGPAGIGKTHTARAMARRLGDIPVYEVGADELTAPAVRAIFAALDRRHPRSVLVIDEIDLVGGERSESDAGAKRILAALLTALDGLRTATGVLVVAATSRPSWELDPALIRAGRLGWVLEIRHPDGEARRALLEHFLAPRPVAPDIDLGPLVEMTPFTTPADLKAGCADAAGIALAAGRDVIAQEDLVAAFERGGHVTATVEPEPIDPEVLRRVSVHEAGHAIVGALVHGVDWLQAVHIGPRSGSVDFSRNPDGDEAVDETSARDAITTFFAGYLAERAVLGTAALTHENDTESATDIARRLVEGGLESSLPPVNLDSWLFRHGPVADRAGEAVVALLAAGRERATMLVTLHRDAIEALAEHFAGEARTALEADRYRRPAHLELERTRQEIRRLIGPVPALAGEEDAA